jgi:serine/threonine protein kinase
MNERHHVLIGDFGSSRFQADSAIPTREAATIEYAAPEQYEETATPTPKSDVFSFGRILYELLVRSPVFSPSQSRFDVVRCLCKRERRKVLDSCRFFLQDVIRRCWAHDPDARTTLDQIRCDFRHYNFDIVPKAAPNEIQDYSDGILD